MNTAQIYFNIEYFNVLSRTSLRSLQLLFDILPLASPHTPKKESLKHDLFPSILELYMKKQIREREVDQIADTSEN